jgi:formylglycine-generating enzyme required for sulfatase activity
MTPSVGGDEPMLPNVAATRPDGVRGLEPALPPPGFVNSAGMRLVRLAGPDGACLHIGLHPVTQRQYAAVTGANPAHFDERSGGGPDHPVEGVSWYEAAEFCRRLSATPVEAAAGRVYRLPTRAEWRRAAEAGRELGVSAPGDGAANLDDVGRGRTSPVGEFGLNSAGLYDMRGNVWEWCSDLFGGNEVQRTVCGGAWSSREDRATPMSPDVRGDDIGFRVVCDRGGTA